MDEITHKLEKIVEDIADITDPGSMDKILMILEEIRIQDEEYMEILVNKLSNEEVTWEQPWYQKSHYLTRKPPPLETETDGYATGHFTKDESELIERNWEALVSQYKIPDKPICLARWKNRGKNKNKKCPEEWVRFFVTAYVAQGLKRNLYQVNQYFLQHYAYPSQFKLMQYTALEEKVMEICFYHRPGDAGVTLSAVLGREPRGIYKKLDEYYNGKPEGKKLKWTLELATQLVNRLREYSTCTVKELKNNQFPREVWARVGEELGQRFRYVQLFWNSTLHVQLFAKCAIKSISIRRTICKKLLKSPQYRVWTDIRWNDVARTFPDGFTAAFLYSIAQRTVRKYPRYYMMPLAELMERALQDNQNRNLKWQQKRLKAVKFSKKGYLKYTSHDTPFRQLMKSD